LRSDVVLLDYDMRPFGFVLRDVLRLQREFGLGRADVLMSGRPVRMDASHFGYGVVEVAGWHVEFNCDPRPWGEVLRIMRSSRSHRGHVYFSELVGDATLRKSAKPDGTPPPRPVISVALRGRRVEVRRW
jgi:hypothetical protein